MSHPFQELITLHGDFESYFDSDLTLKKLNYTDYVNHPDFLLYGGSFRLSGQPNARFYTSVELPDFFASLDWSKLRFVAHNTLFDGYILHRLFNRHPLRYACTLAMMRAVHQGAVDNDLGAASAYYGLPAKQVETLKDLKGKRHLTPNEWALLESYCNTDTDNCAELDALLSPHLPASEHELLDMTLGQFCKPTLQIHEPTARLARRIAFKEKHELIKATGYTKKQLSGDNSFAQLLRDAGVEPPMKQGKKGPIFAFAKTDLEFEALQRHPDERVRRLVAARAAVQSTQAETRAQRFINMAKQGEYPVALHYAGAHTWRWSGTNKANAQNLARGSVLRRSAIAPPDHVIAVGDSAQIEPRVLALLAGHTELLEDFRLGVDVYCKLATQIYGRTVTKADIDERHIGKCARLGLGFRMGWETFMLRLENGSLGGKIVRGLPPEFFQGVVRTFRSDPFVPRFWDTCARFLWHMCYGDPATPMTHMGLVVHAGINRIDIPGGTFLLFPNLHHDGRRYTYFADGIVHDIYDGKLCENIVQAYARNVVAHQALIINRRFRVVSSSHDELWALLPSLMAERGLAWMLKVMSTPPPWAAGLPLAAEGKQARYYAK